MKSIWFELYLTLNVFWLFLLYLIVVRIPPMIIFNWLFFIFSNSTMFYFFYRCCYFLFFPIVVYLVQCFFFSMVQMFCIAIFYFFQSWQYLYKIALHSIEKEYTMLYCFLSFCILFDHISYQSGQRKNPQFYTTETKKAWKSKIALK